MIFDEESASDAQKFLAPAKHRILEKKLTPIFLKKITKTIFCDIFSNILFFFQESCVLEELGFFERHRQIPCRKSLPVVRLFFLYDPWRRGKSGTNRFCS